MTSDPRWEMGLWGHEVHAEATGWAQAERCGPAKGAGEPLRQDGGRVTRLLGKDKARWDYFQTRSVSSAGLRPEQAEEQEKAWDPVPRCLSALELSWYSS